MCTQGYARTASTRLCTQGRSLNPMFPGLCTQGRVHQGIELMQIHVLGRFTPLLMLEGL